MVESSTHTFDKLPSVKSLHDHYGSTTSATHLRDLLQNESRNSQLRAQLPGEGGNGDVILDLTHVKIDEDGIKQLHKVAEEVKLSERIEAMFTGSKINNTEKRAVLHVALRMNEDESLIVPDSDEGDAVKNVHEVQKRIHSFSEQVRSGQVKGYSGKNLTNTLVIGIGGSYLGPEFVFEALREDDGSKKAEEGRRLKFLANVDPIDFNRAVEGLDIEETLVVINSKTFTTAETMLNAMTVKNYIIEHYKKTHPDVQNTQDFVVPHFCAVSTNLPLTSQFGIADDRVFGFWDWVGGRYSVSSAVGVLPLSLHYGYSNVKTFLAGAKSIDNHFRHTKDLSQNLPVLLGLFGFYNTYIAGHSNRAILPYCQALLKFPAHIQQLDMESNGKGVTNDGTRLDKGVEAGPIIFGEPGTNGQHSFYQLMHQGRVIPAEFIGFTQSQTPVNVPGYSVSNHNELMSNFFAQPDALALGKTLDQLKSEGVPEALLQHKFFTGDRPSLSLLFTGKLTPFSCGQLLALYEHRVAVEGFIYGINSFDQWGVELGKVLAKDVRTVFADKEQGKDVDVKSKFNPATAYLLEKYLEKM